jgi:hypothetical protein
MELIPNSHLMITQYYRYIFNFISFHGTMKRFLLIIVIVIVFSNVCVCEYIEFIKNALNKVKISCINLMVEFENFHSLCVFDKHTSKCLKQFHTCKLLYDFLLEFCKRLCVPEKQ